MDFSNLELQNVSFNSSGTNIQIFEEKPMVRGQVQDLSLTFAFSHNITTGVDFLKDEGKSLVRVDNLTATFSGSPLPHSDDSGTTLHGIEITELIMNLTDIELDLHGGDLTGVVSNFADIITSFIKKSLITKFNDEMKASLEETINGFLATKKTLLQLEKYGIW